MTGKTTQAKDFATVGNPLAGKLDFLCLAILNDGCQRIFNGETAEQNHIVIVWQ